MPVGNFHLLCFACRVVPPFLGMTAMFNNEYIFSDWLLIDCYLYPCHQQKLHTPDKKNDHTYRNDYGSIFLHKKLHLLQHLHHTFPLQYQITQSIVTDTVFQLVREMKLVVDDRCFKIFKINIGMFLQLFANFV